MGKRSKRRKRKAAEQAAWEAEAAADWKAHMADVRAGRKPGGAGALYRRFRDAFLEKELF
jgi:hypothetical protein